jgi:alkylhydroperoxidase family enzyme
MAWIETGDERDDLPNILRSHSSNQPVLRGHLALYRAIMFGESGLTRAEREALAVTVSQANDCYY